MAVRTYLQDITTHPVTIDEAGEDTWIRGLPIFRVGTWNGYEYTAADLEAMIGNEGTLRDGDGFEPALKPYHTVDNNGDWVAFDPADTQGWIGNLRWADPEAQDTLLADVRVVEPAVVENIRADKLRYLSSEVSDDYVMADGSQIGPALVGVAWVDQPAVRGIPWSLGARRQTIHCHGMGGLSAEQIRNVVAAQIRDLYPEDDYPWVADVYEDRAVIESDGRYYRHGYTVSNGSVTVDPEAVEVIRAWQELPEPTTRGAQRMGMWEKLRGILRGLGASDDELAVLPEDVDEETPDEGEQVQAHGAAPAGRPDPQVTQLEKAVREQETQIAALKTDARTARIGGLVDELVKGGRVAPANRPRVYALLDRLAQAGSTIKVFARDDQGEAVESDADPVELLCELLGEKAPRVSVTAHGLAYDGGDPGDVSGEEVKAAAERMGKLVGGEEG